MGCDLEDSESLTKFLKEKQSRLPKFQKRLQNIQNTFSEPVQSENKAESTVNGELDLAPAGKRGAAAALERLEHQEEESHRRLQAALARSDTGKIQQAQEFWLKCSETLRRLDLAVEVARRNEETQIPLRQAEAVITFATEWMRVAFMSFLSAESRALMGIHDVGEWKFYAMTRFKGILDLTIKNAEKTNSAIPDWAKERIKTAWNVE